MKLFWCIIGIFVASVGWGANLDRVVVHEENHHVFVRCTLSGAFEYNVFTLPNPNRVILDLPLVKNKYQFYDMSNFPTKNRLNHTYNLLFSRIKN